MALTEEGARRLEDCLARGGVAVVGTDTVYGLACDPEDEAAVRRLYELKGRAPGKPAAVMWLDRDAALAALPDLGPRTRGVCERLLPGGVTLLLPNPERRFPLAAGGDPAAATTLGVRVIDVGARIPRPVLQSSANHAGGPDARRLADVPEDIRARADLVLDAGELPGTASTVIDLRSLEEDGAWRIVRHGAVPDERVAAALADDRPGDAST